MIGVGLLTYNQFRTKRHNFFRDTLASIDAETHPHTLDIVTNGSTDRTDVVVRKLGGIVDNRNSAAWYGMERAINAALAHQPDIVVLSADDLAYQAGWMDALAAFWDAAPDDVVLAGCFLENCWAWNTIVDTVEYGGVRALIRTSVPSASWTFRARDAALILPMERTSPGEDIACCRRLLAHGYRLAQLDLATHTGAFQSAWGNRSEDYAIPLDREKWGFS